MVRYDEVYLLSEQGTPRRRRTRFYVIVGVIFVAVVVAVVVGVVLSMGGNSGPAASEKNIALTPSGPKTYTQAPITSAPSLRNQGTPAPITPAPITPAPIVASTLAPTEETTAPSPAPVVIEPTTPITGKPSSVPSFSPSRSLLALISSVAAQSGAKFADSTSYQSKSFAWLENDVNLVGYSDAQKIQRYALGCVYYATFSVQSPYTAPPPVAGWGNATGWVTDMGECAWYGVTCDSMGFVTSLELNANNLTGTFPEEIALVAETLEKLDIGENAVNNINSELDFLGQLTNLKHLDVGLCNFDYVGIPPAIGMLTKLEWLDISYTLMFGPIRGPEVFVNLNNLAYLEMGGNSYNQSIPSEIYTLPNLARFYCDDAFLNGDVSFIPQMPVIFEVWLDINPDLGGSIPTEIGALTTLQSLSISECALSGTLPSELGNIQFMQQMWLFDNLLGGNIPSEIGQLSILKTFQTEKNMLTGRMPWQVCILRSGILEQLSTDCAGPAEVDCTCCTCCVAPCHLS